MDKRSRAYKLAKRGEDAWNQVFKNETNDIRPLLCAIAVMLDAATAKGKAATAFRQDPDAVAFIDSLLAVAGDTVVSEPFDTKWYKLAEWRMREVDGMTPDSAYVIGEYLAAGGWKGKALPTVEQILRYYPDLLRKAEDAGTHDPRWNV